MLTWINRAESIRLPVDLGQWGYKLWMTKEGRTDVGQPAGIGGIGAGNRIFVQGDPDHGVAACSACHGANAQGTGIFPRLAGQRAE